MAVLAVGWSIGAGVLKSQVMIEYNLFYRFILDFVNDFKAKFKGTTSIRGYCCYSGLSLSVDSVVKFLWGGSPVENCGVM